MLKEVHVMEKKRKRYTAEFKAEAVRVARENKKPIYQQAMDIGVSDTALRRWIRQDDIDQGKGPAGALTTEEREELTRLRRENRQVKMERDFLKKASAFFARESA
jgi:transposase